MTKCRACGLEIRWVTLPDGKRLAVDPWSNAAGDVEVSGNRGRCLTRGEAERRRRAPGVALHRKHYKRCPARSKGRRR